MLSCISSVFGLRADVSKFPILEKEGNWGELTFAKTSGTVTRDNEKNWPIVDQRVHSYDPRNNRETHFGPSSLLVLKWRIGDARRLFRVLFHFSAIIRKWFW